MNAGDIRRFLDTDPNQTVHMSWSKIRDAHFDTLLTPERLSNESKAQDTLTTSEEACSQRVPAGGVTGYVSLAQSLISGSARFTQR